MYTSRHSRALSFESRATSSTSNTASTDTSTIWGPGTLSGKAIEAFGEATLRGVENVVIRRKLSTYRSLFPHADDTTIKNIDTVYENVLELSRPNLYSKNTTQAALRLMMIQIARRETLHLRKALQKWPTVELQFFLSQIMDMSMHPYENWSHDVSGRKKSEALRDAKHLTPVIDFIAFVADHSDLACHAAVDAGFLDILLRIYAVFPMLEQGTSDLVSACTFTLLMLSKQSDCLEAMIRHPVCLLWKKCSQPFHDEMPDVVDDSISIRRLSWSRTEKLCVMSRLVTIYSLISTSRLKEAVAIDMCVDLVEFASGSLFYDSDIIGLATLAIFRCIVVGGDCTRYLAIALTCASCQDVVAIFSCIVRLWLAYVHNRDNPEMPLDCGIYVGVGSLGANPSSLQLEPSILYRSSTVCEGFYIRAKSLLFWKMETAQRRIFPLDDRPLHNILKFVINAAKSSMIVQWGMLDAGILALLPLALMDGVVPLLSGLLNALGQPSNGDSSLPPEHKPGSGVETDSHETNATVIPLAVINTGASLLVRYIQTQQFQGLLCSEVFVKRRSVCSSLLDTFLGNECGVDGIYSETRNVFTQILAERDIPLIPVGSVNSRSSVELSVWEPFITPTGKVRPKPLEHSGAHTGIF